VPTYVIDLPGGGGKVPLQANYLVSRSDGQLVFRNYLGKTYSYHNPRPASASAGRNGRRKTNDQQMALELVAAK